MAHLIELFAVCWYCGGIMKDHVRSGHNTDATVTDFERTKTN